MANNSSSSNLRCLIILEYIKPTIKTSHISLMMVYCADGSYTKGLRYMLYIRWFLANKCFCRSEQKFEHHDIANR